MLRNWEHLPESMRTEAVRPYYEILKKKTAALYVKRLFDILLAVVLLLLLLIPMLIIGICIKADSEGPVFYRQERVTTYGRVFRIHKFRTMVNHADQIGTAVTVNQDARITSIGKKIRNLRLDELPQLLDVLEGNMSFVGTRPEAVKYVKRYEPEYMATLLLPAGITSEASIRFRNEAELLDGVTDTDEVYVKQILPEKMKWNLDSIRQFSLCNEFKTMVKTVTAVFGK